jgi:hypothetical protein
MLMFSLRKLMSASSYLGFRVAPMRANLVLLPGTSSTSLVSLDFVAAQVASLLGMIGGRDLLSIGDGLLHVDRELEGFSGCVTLLLAVISDENIAPEGQYAFLGWHLQD